MSGLHTRDLEIPSVTGVSLHQGVTATANEMDVTDGGQGSIKEGGENGPQSRHERGGVQKQGEWMNGTFFKREKWLLPIPIELRTGDIWNTVRKPGS